MKRPLLSPLLCMFLTAAPAAGSLSIPDDPPSEIIRVIPAVGFMAATGRAGSRGREVDHQRHRPGFVLLRPADPLLLEPGFYRATFVLRRGQYPSEGFLRPTFPVFRIDVFDGTTGSAIAERELQVSELDSANGYEPRWLEFSMDGREGHLIEPRVYWPGLVNGEVESVRIERLPVDSPARLEDKAHALTDRILRDHLENGFIVSRKAGGEPDETGDATTYTGFYAASLAWKFGQTNDQMTLQALENAMEALHLAIKGTPEEPIITRYVDEHGTPAAKSPSKDVYAAFFFACAAAYPHIRNESLRAQIRRDVDRIATKLLRDDLAIRGGALTLASLAPHFDPSDIRQGIDIVTTDNRRRKKLVRELREARRYVPFQELWPGMNELIRALEKRQASKLYDLVVPTMNGVIVLSERVLDLLRESSRNDLVRLSGPAPERPGRHLAALLSESLKKLPAPRDGRRFHSLSDLRVLASNAIIALHIVKTAAVITGSAQFEEYYRQNLYTQDALLKTVMDWYGTEDELMRRTAGNASASRERRGYLALLSAYNLYTLETNSAVRDAYREVIAREARLSRHDDNPLTGAIALAAGVAVEPVSMWRGLTLYPEDPVGFGEDFWKENSRRVAEAFGGGESQGHAREPLPVSHRPRDSFLWQRNARRLRGDFTNRYPGADYLFLYWLARKHGLVPAPENEPIARQDN